MRKSVSTILTAVALTIGSTVAVATPASATSSEPGPMVMAAGTQICYKAHVQNEGWEDPLACDGQEAGSTGQARNMEALAIQSKGVGKLCAWAHVQDQGWDDQPSCTDYDGQMVVVGTVGKNRAIEAVYIEVSAGHVAAKAHLRNYGWTEWTPYNSSVSIGTVGQNRPMEAIKLAVQARIWA
ncbi:hypothetical protein AB0E71_28335 [Streptomyces narbonensis]|uniref:hypothetical protein n=1 Tax=Streptomyces narbonensis TaxID=67333 RepID=UPI0033E2B736